MAYVKRISREGASSAELSMSSSDFLVLNGIYVYTYTWSKETY